MSGDRITNYDSLADQYDTRYRHYHYDGVGETLIGFLGQQPSIVLEVGCGTGHWLAFVSRASGDSALVAGLEPSGPMLRRARTAAPSARLVRARAQELPFGSASVDRVFCVNALHHFTDRARFFAEARRILKPGGGLLTIGMDPHTERDDWWVYQYFEETRAIDRDRFPRVRTLRGEMALAGFAWTESMEAEHVEIVQPATEAIDKGIVDRSFTSQLTVLSDEEFQRGLDRLRRANEEAGGELQLVADFRLYATTAWV